MRDLGRLLRWDGSIPRERRGQVEAFLNHANERVRRRAREVLAEDVRRRMELRRIYEVEERLLELAWSETPAEDSRPWDGLEQGSAIGELPF